MSVSATFPRNVAAAAYQLRETRCAESLRNGAVTFERIGHSTILSSAAQLLRSSNGGPSRGRAGPRPCWSPPWRRGDRPARRRGGPGGTRPVSPYRSPRWPRPMPCAAGAARRACRPRCEAVAWRRPCGARARRTFLRVAVPGASLPTDRRGLIGSPPWAWPAPLGALGAPSAGGGHRAGAHAPAGW
jgi:hypothetical protein